MSAVGGSHLLTASVVAGLLISASAGVAGQEPGTPTPRTPVIVLEMDETTADAGLEGRIRAELDGLWSPYGITVAAPDELESDAGACLAVKVVLTDDEPGIKPEPHRRPLGIVYRVGGMYRRVVFVSPAAVMRLVRKSAAEPRASAVVASLHARMLARVIAHEIGHILLESEDHAPRGLMRGRFRPADVVQPGLERFTLEPHESDRVASRCGVPPPAGQR